MPDEAEGIRFAYRRFGNNGGLPLVMCQSLQRISCRGLSSAVP
jgi:hypothetical protein